MFTGIIKEVGLIKSAQHLGNSFQFTIGAPLIAPSSYIGASISVNGVCLTVTGLTPTTFTVEAIAETISKSNLKDLKTNDKVNLEPAMQLSERLDGHLVLGHVDATVKITGIKHQQRMITFSFSIPDELAKFIASKGSVAIDGISLTVSDIINHVGSVSIIPHTWENTTLFNRKIGDFLNLEIDVLARYINNMVQNK
jgi:riboflavin synthase